MENVKTNKALKEVLCDIISDVNEQRIKENNIKVLVLSKEKRTDAPIEKTSYYSEECIEEIVQMMEQLRSGSVSLKDIPQYKAVETRECAGYEGREFIIQCIMLEEAVHYHGLIQYILDEIGQAAEYPQFEKKKRIEKLRAGLDMNDRTILMEKYAKKFLAREKLPAAELLIELSAQRYEGSGSEARIYIENESIEDRNRVCFFDKTGERERILESDKLRTIRKLMEMSRRKVLYLLASKDMGIVGMLSFDSEGEEKRVNGQSKYISFNGHMQWSVYIEGKEEICYRQGKYYINSSDGKSAYSMEVNKFKQRTEGRITDILVQMIEEIVKILSEQHHGTTVIITDDVREAGRLCEVDRGILLNIEDGQNFRKSDGGFDRDKLLSVTEIDGALYMDMEGQCTAFGVIVDGIACEKGNTGRGARYNSIYNYVRQKRDGVQYIALIFSEDGGVDIIDNLDVFQGC